MISVKMDDKYGLLLEIESVILVQPALHTSNGEFFWVVIGRI